MRKAQQTSASGAAAEALPIAGDTYTIRGYARFRRVDVRTIWEAVQRGEIRLVDGRIVGAQADATWYRSYLRRNDGLRSGVEAAERREKADLTRAVADLQLHRKKVETLRARVAERDASQAQIAVALDVLNQQTERYLDTRVPSEHLQEIIDELAADLGDLQAEALKVTRIQ